jgi:hypothetical protein
MKAKMKGVLGIALSLVLLASLMVFALPASAGPFEDLNPVPNMWTGYDPTPGLEGAWFFDPAIERVGPVAKGIDGDLYAYVAGTAATPNNPGTDDIFKSVDGGRTWSASTIPFYYGGGRVVDMVCSSLSEDVIYLTDGNYVYKSVNGGMSFMTVAAENLESHLMGACGMPITHEPITCIDLAYDGANDPIVFIGTRYVGHLYPTTHALYPGDIIAGTVLWISDETFPAEWGDLQLKCYGCCDIDTTLTTVTDEIFGPTVDGTLNYNGTFANFPVVPGTVVIEDATPTETFTDNGFGVLVGDNGGSGTIDYVTGDWTISYGANPGAGLNIEADYEYASVIPTGCFDVFSVGCAPDFATTNKAYALISTLDEDCDGTNEPSTQVVSTVGTTCSWNFIGELFYDCDAVTPLNFAIIHASRFAFPDDFADTHSMFLGVTAWDGSDTNVAGGDVYLIADTIPLTPTLDLNVQGYTSGCTGLYHANICSLDIMGGTNDGSLIAGAYDTYENQAATEVFYSTDGGWTWDDSDKDPTGLGLPPTTIPVSTTGTGTGWTYVLWYDQTAVAGTAGCNCAFSMSCGDEVGKYWNQISLIAMSIDVVLDLSHAPGYLDGSTTMYVLTWDEDSCADIGEDQESVSLFRWDGSNWERVFSSLSPEYVAVVDTLLDWVEVSPDFNDTDCLYMANNDFQMFRSIDRGCSWRMLAYPCDPLPEISAWIVVDEETVLAAGATGSYAGTIYRTTRHGTRPWSEFPCLTSTGLPACDGVDFDLSLPRGATSDVLFGDACGQVYLSQDLGETWAEIEDAITHDFADDTDETYVVFDPGYAVADDPGMNTIYAAGGQDIGRCAINFDALMTKQNWVYIDDASASCDPCTLQMATGIDATGDTVLYVSDAGSDEGNPGSVTVTGTIEVDCSTGSGEAVCICDRDLVLSAEEVTVISGSFTSNELVEIVTYNLVCTTECIEDECICTIAGEIGIRGFESEAYGQIDILDEAVITCGSLVAVDDEVIGSGDDTEVTFSGTLVNYPICVGSLSITDGTETFTDNGDGTLTGSAGGTGTINYTTGAYSVTFNAAPATGVDNITGDYNYIADCNYTGNALIISSHLQVTATAATSDEPTGVWRSVNPLDPMPPVSPVPLVEWEFLSFGLSPVSFLAHFPTYTFPDDLWLTMGSNVLWALDFYPTLWDTIWMWDDPLAAPVIQVAPADGALLATPTTATLEWEALDGATMYEVYIYSYCATCPTLKNLEYSVLTANTCLPLYPDYPLLAGTKYYWKVRVACDSPYVSKWSDLREFDTALGSVPGLCSPICGSDDIILNTNFSWDEVVGATGYELQIAAASADGTVDWTGATTYTSSVNALASIPGLEYSTVYYWRVRAISDGVAGAWAVCIFTTMDEPEVPPEPEPPVEVTIEEVTPTWIWVLIGIGGALMIAVIILIVTTRRVP